MSGTSPDYGRAAIKIAAVIFAAIALVSLGLALTQEISLPNAGTTQGTQTGRAPYVLVEVVELNSTTYTRTFTTTPRQSVVVIIYPEVLVVVNGNQTYTITTTVTTTSTTWV